ncbi:hypothetical protein FNV43_RR10717 [Rhamnella rubrinervis]|uniref:Uncharacterized protein n=1 Tax=Rhamnella rubrinervis TaxID=2594499 RepID=A0A8K0H4G3_9ROSA|nr:hypothetical protein FNV43_RR10717 [Rhamnella rubrinervis]
MASLKANLVMVMAIILLIFSSVATALSNDGPALPNFIPGRRVLSVSKQLPGNQPESSGKGSDSHKPPTTKQAGYDQYPPRPPEYPVYPPTPRPYRPPKP